MPKTYSYLALGDSYTIGEGVPVYENFPYQTVQRLRKAGYALYAAEIVAKTGWTTDELPRQALTIVVFWIHTMWYPCSLGENNQYRGRNLQEYTQQFESLLKQAIRFAGNQANHVFVVSIPDWGVTPYATNNGKNTAVVAHRNRCIQYSEQIVGRKIFSTLYRHYTGYPAGSQWHFATGRRSITLRERICLVGEEAGNRHAKINVKVI